MTHDKSAERDATVQMLCSEFAKLRARVDHLERKAGVQGTCKTCSKPLGGEVVDSVYCSLMCSAFGTGVYTDDEEEQDA